MRRQGGVGGRVGRGLLRRLGRLLLAGLLAGLSPGMRAAALTSAPAGGGVAAGGDRTWFVRPDGGDRKQCTGLADAAYKGHGSNQPCAFKHPQMLFSNDEYNNKKWIVAGGDTMVVRGGPYRMGYRGPDPKDAPGLCPGNPYECYIAAGAVGNEGAADAAAGRALCELRAGCEDAAFWRICAGAGGEPE